MIFSKIDKKILIILIAVVVAILLIVFVAYKYILSPGIKVQNSAGGAQTEKQTQQVQVQVGGVGAQGTNGGGTLSVCIDKCGDGICEKTDPNCSADNNLNCICPETPQECPQDCK